jgi:integrase
MMKSAAISKAPRAKATSPVNRTHCEKTVSFRMRCCEHTQTRARRLPPAAASRPGKFSSIQRTRSPPDHRAGACSTGWRRTISGAGVRPKHVVKTGKTPVLEGAEWRKLLKSIPDTTLRDLRDRALIATLTYSFARITAALKMKVEDLRPRGTGWTIRLHEKGGKQHSMPCHHALAEALRAYIDAAGIVDDRKGWLFPHCARAQRQYLIETSQ